MACWATWRVGSFSKAVDFLWTARTLSTLGLAICQGKTDVNGLVGGLPIGHGESTDGFFRFQALVVGVGQDLFELISCHGVETVGHLKLLDERGIFPP